MGFAPLTDSTICVLVHYAVYFYNMMFTIIWLLTLILSKVTLREEIAQIKAEIDNLRPMDWSTDDLGFVIRFQGILCLCDGKVVNVLTDNNSSLRCPFCHATPTQMSNPDGIFEILPSALNLLCLSILHFGLRSFELLMNIGFIQDFRQWQVRKGSLNEAQYSFRKKKIQAAYKLKGLNIFEPRSDGSGTSNDGNTARRCFDDHEFFAKQCNVPMDLVFIGIVLASGLPIDPDKFSEFCKKTQNIYFDNVSWYRPSASLHKILEHTDLVLRYIHP
jgi:ABC-type multidrug transport system fused ATPase/permease subunit